MLPGCSNKPETKVSEKSENMSAKVQIDALKTANANLYTNPKQAKDIARDSENWNLDSEGLALRQWLHTQQQANRGDLDQAWRMIHDINISYLPKNSQKEFSTLYWHIATMLNVCPQRQGTHEQQFNYLAVTENPQCEQYLDTELKTFIKLIKDVNNPDWATNLNSWHESNPLHWANDFIKWHKLKDAKQHSKQVAVILPLSGDYAQTGKEIQEGMLTVQPFLSQVTLSFHDTAELGPQQAYNEAIKTNPEFIIGPLTMKEMQAIETNNKVPMLSFAPSQYAHQNVMHMSHDPYQIQKLLRLSKSLGHKHLVWLTDPIFNNMQSYWPESVARFGQIPIKAEELKTLLLVDDNNTKTTNATLKYDGLMLLGKDTYDLQTVAHEYTVNPIQTFVTLPDVKEQTNFYEHTVMLKSTWLNANNDNTPAFSPFDGILSKLNASNQSWYNAVGIDALLMSYYNNEINSIKAPISMASGLRQVNKDEFSFKLNAHHIQDSKWHPLLTLDGI